MITYTSITDVTNIVRSEAGREAEPEGVVGVSEEAAGEAAGEREGGWNGGVCSLGGVPKRP